MQLIITRKFKNTFEDEFNGIHSLKIRSLIISLEFLCRDCGGTFVRIFKYAEMNYFNGIRNFKKNS